MNFGNAVNGYRISRWFYLHKMGIIAKILRGGVYLIHNSYIPYTAEIGKGTIFGYKGIGCVIHSKAVIGENCVIGANVTIGGRGRPTVPVIGNNVYISTGAKILGDVKVGNNVTIGANAVLICDAPDNTVWAGVPAKCIKTLSDDEIANTNTNNIKD